MSLTLDREFLKGFVGQNDIDALASKIKKAHDDLHNKTGKGNDFLGWVDLPGKIPDALIKELEALGNEVRKDSDALISIGIGGSYLGIRATVEYLGGGKLPVYYAGHNMSADYLHNLLETLKDQRITVVVISKSGTTTEPALAFRIVKQFMQKKYKGDELKKRIICVTDAKKGALRQIAEKTGHRTYVIPDDVGGRFSILTPVGLVPLAVAGVDIKSFVEGARKGEQEYGKMDLNANTAYQYAAIRHALYHKGKVIEVLASFYDNMYYVTEWWKQLFGESEGKQGQGIFPASMIFSTDLHSMGQLMQDGMRNIFETFLTVDQPRHTVIIPKEEDDLDKFNCMAGKDLDFVNKQAFRATAMAHYEGGIPNLSLKICKADEFHLGQLYYLFEKAVGISGYLSGVNPFDQPGVEAYKKKMFGLLGMK
ncbi:MAG: glucose-6-phosphate isomerase [Candidatus Omnitrophota bacterium]|nr:glucose-6-phosphate isomerase [Candidatus Omnitrophota bacterium]MDZ4242709.1 glucose-6-phosphate isomerase [Candidatus Omnitrophota bacterium]